MSTPGQAFIDAALMTAARIGYDPAPASGGVTVGDIVRIALTDSEDAARRVWDDIFRHDPDSFAVIMADAREARAAAERRAALWMRRRVGVLQIPPILEVPEPYTGRAHRATGVRCPRCQRREVVYNGNYFCAGFDDDECRWALVHEEPVFDFETAQWYDVDPAWWDFDDMLVLIGCAGGRRGSVW